MNKTASLKLAVFIVKHSLTLAKKSAIIFVSNSKYC